MATKPMNIITLGGIGDSNADYQAQEDLRTLSRAAIIKKDKKRYNAALKLAKEQIDTLENLDSEIEEEEKDD